MWCVWSGLLTLGDSHSFIFSFGINQLQRFCFWCLNHFQVFFFLFILCHISSRIGRQSVTNGSTPFTAEQLLTNMRLIEFICAKVTWSQKGRLNYGPAVRIVCVLTDLLCSYFWWDFGYYFNVCSLNSFISEFIWITWVEKFVHKLINSFLMIQSVAPLALF